MIRKIQVKPSKKQYKALLILLKDNWVSFLWYWWAAWWGKTILAAMWISMMCKKYPWVTYWVFRRFITDVLDTTFKSFTKALHLLGMIEAESIDVLKRSPDKYDFCVRNWWKEIIFSNWSEIWFRWLQDKPTDVHFTKIGWLELTGAFIDEANECPEQWVAVLKKRVWRHMNAEYNIPRKVLCTFNPDKWWVYRTFYTPFKQWREIEWTLFIPALPTDNPYLTDEYLAELKNEKNEVIKQRLYYGNFDYDDTPGRLFDYDKIISSFEPKNPYNKRKYISCDVARQGNDKCVIFVWEWFNIIDHTIYDKSSIPEIIEEIRYYQNKYWIENQRTIVDEDWVGWWVVDWLGCIWFVNNSTPVSPYWAKNNNYLKRNYQNLKTQCYFELARIVNDWICYFDVDLEIKDWLIEELDIIVQINLDDDNKIKIIPKDEIKEKLGRSPDYSDACMMRCYFELVYEWLEEEILEPIHRPAEYTYLGKSFTLEELMSENYEEKDDTTL